MSCWVASKKIWPDRLIFKYKSILLWLVDVVAVDVKVVVGDNVKVVVGDNVERTRINLTHKFK